MSHHPEVPPAASAPQPDPLAAISAGLPVSIVMPVRNEERYLAEAVSHVLSQDYPGELELILAVGPSHDRTAEIAKRISAADSRVTVVGNPTGKIPSGINAALKVARYSIVARVDGHALLPPGYLSAAVAAMAETGAVNVGGIMAAEGVTPFQRAVAWAMTSPFGVGAASFHTGGTPGPADTVYLGVYRRAAIEQVGGYNESFLVAEDWELNHRLRLAGGLIWFEPGLRVTYRPRPSVAALGTQYFRYGRWRRVVSRQHPGTINFRYLTPPAVVTVVAAGTLAGVAGLAALAAGAAGTGATWAAAATAGFAAPLAYLAGVLVVSALAARQLHPAAAARLPLVLATMHASWGTGFLTSPGRLIPDAGPAAAE